MECGVHACHAKYRSTFSDTSRKKRICGFRQRHGNYSLTTGVHTHTHIPPETHRMSQSATSATQNDMTTSSDRSSKTRFGSFPHRHGSFTLTTAAHTHTHTFLLKHVKCHKAPRLTRKTTGPHLLRGQVRHVFVAVPKDVATLVPRRPCTHIRPDTPLMSKSAQNDRSTASDMSRKTRSCGFPQRHGNLSPTTAVHTHSS